MKLFPQYAIYVHTTFYVLIDNLLSRLYQKNDDDDDVKEEKAIERTSVRYFVPSSNAKRYFL